MEAAAAAMLEAGVGRFSRAPAMAAALVAEMWAPLAVMLAALATLPSLLRRLQLIVLRIRSRGKEAIQAHMVTYYSSGDDDDSDSGSGSGGDEDEDEESSDEAGATSSGEEEGGDWKRIGYFEGADGCFPWGGGAVVRTWQDLPRRLSGCVGSAGARLAAAPSVALPAVRLWGASTANGEPWWAGADEGGCRTRTGAAAEASSSSSSSASDAVVLGWRRDPAVHLQRRRRRAPPPSPSPTTTTR